MARCFFVWAVGALAHRRARPAGFGVCCGFAGVRSGVGCRPASAPARSLFSPPAPAPNGAARSAGSSDFGLETSFAERFSNPLSREAWGFPRHVRGNADTIPPQLIGENQGESAAPALFGAVRAPHFLVACSAFRPGPRPEGSCRPASTEGLEGKRRGGNVCDRRGGRRIRRKRAKATSALAEETIAGRKTRFRKKRRLRHFARPELCSRRV